LPQTSDIMLVDLVGNPPPDACLHPGGGSKHSTPLRLRPHPRR
jgi:hypothetical protein